MSSPTSSEGSQTPPQSPLLQTPPRSATAAADREARLAALQRRLDEQAADAAATVGGLDQPAFIPFDANHEKRQEFRRLIDPGIMRPNAREVALASLRTLSTIAENILREPLNPKFRQFKPTNSMIKRNLVDPKGALEYAVALGFRPEIQNFQPSYVFSDKFLPDLRIGADIVKEVIRNESEKQEREETSKRLAKAAEEARVEKVKKAFMDDRKSKLLRDQIQSSGRAPPS